MEKKNIIAIIGTKGGVGKSTISAQIVTFALASAGAKFEMFEMDNNNKTAKALDKSELLAGKFKTLNLDASDEELEKIFLNLAVSDYGKKYIIDVGGGDDTNRFLELIRRNHLTEQTLFIVPFMPNFESLDNLESTTYKIKNYDYLVVLNNVNTKEADEMMFAHGEEEYEILNMSELLGEKFFVLPKSHLFSLCIARYHQVIWDVHAAAKEINIAQVAKSEKFRAMEEQERRTFFRRFKLAEEIKEYVDREEVQKFMKRIQKSMGLA
jgi:cellulose biosynthesis protein BcsQ